MNEERTLLKNGAVYTDASKKRSYRIIFFAVLVLQLCMSVYFASKKSGYFVDELWSYGLANSYYHAHVYSDGALDDWVDGDYFRDYIVVNDGEEFTYGSVFDNQKHDYHPPLFYVVLHTVSSLFPNTFSKWYGIIPNIVYFAVAQFMLFLISRRLLGKENPASLLPMIIFGFTPAAMSYVIYIRMYMMASMWLLMLAYFHIKGITNEKLSVFDLIAIALTTFLGFMTHYYFIVFAFFMAVFYFLWLVIKRKGIKALLGYCAAMLSGLALEYLIFPIAYKKLFADQRGKEAVNNFWNFSHWGKRIERFLKNMNNGLFSGFAFWLVIIMAVLMLTAIVFAIIRLKKNGRSHKSMSGETMSVIMLAATSLLFFVIVTKIAPYQSGRYVYIIYPFIALGGVYLGCKLLEYISAKQMISVALVAVLGLFVGLYGDFTGKVTYLYPEYKYNKSIAEMYEGSDCLYFASDWYLLAGDALELQHMGRVRTLGISQLDIVAKITNPDKKDHIVVCIENGRGLRRNPKSKKAYSKYKNTDEFLEAVKSATGYKKSKLLFESRSKVYLLYN